MNNLFESPDAKRVFQCSPWAAEKCEKEPEWFQQALEGELFKQTYSIEIYQQQLSQYKPLDFQQLSKQLRQWRQREMIRIIWRMSLGLAPLEETMQDLSALAEACVQFAENQLFEWLALKHGAPVDDKGCPQHLVVVALGKLGGYELNLSSDIDLIFAYPDSGVLEGGLTYDEFYLRLAQQLIKALNEITADGYVFRVDMRLRPHGDSGLLVMSFDALENYYQAQGREWERYALIKARPITSTPETKKVFLDLIRPFVYRRYVDYGVLSALRDMYDLIQQELQRKGMKNNIKLGEGGIRCIEFMVQMHQLIRGGRDLQLQQVSLFKAMNELQSLGILSEAIINALKEAYIFLRNTEHALQAVHDQQTHTLPEDPEERSRLAFTLHFSDWDSFKHALEKHQRFVMECFSEYSTPPEVKNIAQHSHAIHVSSYAVSQIWLNKVDEPESVVLLQDLGFKEASAVYKLLRHYADLPICQQLSPKSSQRLRDFIPTLLAQVVSLSDPLLSLERTLDVAMAIVKRSAYLVLLLENPFALRQLIYLCTASSWVTQELSQHPVLLDELLSKPNASRIPSREFLLQELQRSLGKIQVNDVEQQMDILRYIKRVNFLRVAMAELNNLLDVDKTSEILTMIAETILQFVWVLAWKQQTSSAQMGVLEESLVSDMEKIKAIPFAILTYGKLASKELNYNSDLDVVFLYKQSDLSSWGLENRNADEVFLRVAQRMMHWLNTPTHMGILFPVDTQLQPEGNAGLLVSEWNRFMDYQESKAWIWEQQALVRSRIILAPPEWEEAFKQIRRDLLAQPRDQEMLRQAIVDMRSKMRQRPTRKPKQINDTHFDVKRDPGGMIDIEFIVQYTVMRDAALHPELLDPLAIHALCKVLAASGGLLPAQAAALDAAYTIYRKCTHQFALQRLPAFVPVTEFAALKVDVRAVWEQTLGETNIKY